MRAFRHVVRLAFSSRQRPSAAVARKTASVTVPASAVIAAAPFAMVASYYSTTVTKLRAGEDAIPEDARSRPHHVRGKDGAVSGFRNIHPSAGTMSDGWALFKTFLKAKMDGELSFPNATAPDVPTVRKPSFLPTRTSSSAQIRATWLGHACYYVEYPSGLRVLFDPVFEDRCSPVQFMGPKRFTPPPCGVADLPFVDAVVISHSHYDHLSNLTVHEIAKHHPRAHFFVGLGLEKWFRDAGIERVTELDWWESADMTVTPEDSDKLAQDGAGSAPSAGGERITARFGCLPAQHSSGRTGLDKDRTLWCSWGVSSSSASSPDARSVYFGGDTGYRVVPKIVPARTKDGSSLDNPAADYEAPYDSLPVCPQFSQIGELRGPFDLGLIPIGAYKPRHLFSAIHANPFDAVEIFRDTRCKRAMGIHWGTWTLTAEEVLEPPVLLKLALKRKGLDETGVFDVCEIGESREF